MELKTLVLHVRWLITFLKKFNLPYSQLLFRRGRLVAGRWRTGAPITLGKGGCPSWRR